MSERKRGPTTAIPQPTTGPAIPSSLSQSTRPASSSRRNSAASTSSGHGRHQRRASFAAGTTGGPGLPGTVPPAALTSSTKSLSSSTRQSSRSSPHLQISPQRPTQAGPPPVSPNTAFDERIRREVYETVGRLPATPGEETTTGEQHPAHELLQYYRTRIEQFEKEREQYLQRIADLSGPTSDAHRLRWEVLKNKEQIEDMKRALSDAHVYLFYEREMVLKLSAENDELKIQEVEDRKRIQHLLALTQPVSQEVTYIRECRPDKITRNYVKEEMAHAARGGRPTTTSAQAVAAATGHNGTSMDRSTGRPASPRRVVLGTHSTENGSQVYVDDHKHDHRTAEGEGKRSTSSRHQYHGPGSSHRGGGGGGSGGSGSGGTGTLRTIYMPNESAETLKLIIHSLRVQLDEQRKLAEQRCQALVEDRMIRETEHKEREQVHRADVAKLKDDMGELRKLHEATTKDYLDLRHESQAGERKMKEQVRHHREQSIQLENKVKSLEHDAKQKENQTKADKEEYVNLFRNQSMAAAEDLNILKSQYKASQDLYDKRVQFLEGKIVQLKEKNKTLENKSRLDNEGWASDLKLLRQRFRSLERVLIDSKLVAVTEIACGTTGGDIDASGMGSMHTMSGMIANEARADRLLLAETDMRGLAADLNRLAQRLTLTTPS